MLQTHKNKGFVLPLVIFIIVILAFLTYSMFSLNLFMTKGENMHLLEHKAYFAAKTGLGIGLYQAEKNSVCNSTPQTIPLNRNLSNFKTTYSCQSISQNESGNTIIFYQVTAYGCNTTSPSCPDSSGSPSNDDYVQRQVTEIIQQ